MRAPVLSASEVLSYSLVGGRKESPDCFTYDEAVFLGGKRREDRLGAALQIGDRVSVTEGVVLVLRGSKVISAISTHCDQGVVEVPVLLDFM